MFGYVFNDISGAEHFHRGKNVPSLAPDGREGDFDQWFEAQNTDPVGMLEADDLRVLENLLSVVGIKDQP